MNDSTIFSLPFSNYPEINKILYQVYDKKIKVKVFEKWLYEHHQSLEKILPENVVFDLINLNYQDKYAQHEIAKIILPYIDFREIEKEKMCHILATIINQKEPEKITKALELAYDFYCAGYEFFKRLALDFFLKIIEIESYSTNLQQFTEKRNSLIDAFYPEISIIAKDLQHSLNTHQIIFQNEFAERGHLIYQILSK